MDPSQQAPQQSGMSDPGMNAPTMGGSGLGGSGMGGSMGGSNMGGAGMGGSNMGGAGMGGQQAHNDYGDKAFDMLAKKSGHPMNANTSEKITDGARNMFEKVTGYVYPEPARPSVSVLTRAPPRLQQEGQPQDLKLDTGRPDGMR